MSRQALRPPFRPQASVSVALRVVAVVVLLLVAGAVAYELHSSRNELISETERQMSRLDMVFAEQTGRAVEAVDLLVMGAQETVQAQQPHLDGVDETLRHRIRGLRQLAALLVVDLTGQPIVSTDTDRTFMPPAVVGALLARYQADPRVSLLISSPFRVGDSKWNALLARPTFAPDGALTGAAIGSINLNYFEEFYRAVELNENGAIILHLRDGTVLARFPHIDQVIGTSFGNLPPFTEVLAHSIAGTLLMESPIDGSIRVTAIRALRAFPLAVMVSVEQRRILADWRHEAAALVAVALLLGGAVIMLLLSLSLRSREVERLLDETHAARATAEQAKDRLLQQISERERAEGALRQAQRIEAIGQLTGGVAHDFNNLLTVVLGNVDILQRRAALDRMNDMLSDRLMAIRAAAERGATLTSHLLAFARRQPLMPKAIDLNATIHGMGNLLDSALGMRARTELRLAEDLWPTMADQSQIELVILNLVINARDAMPNGGVITIETANHRRTEPASGDRPPAGDYVGITISDTGTGIPREILGRVFEPFFTTKSPAAGSGLGLSQVFGTARQSGGQVHIESVVGRGTSVTVDLPRTAVAPARTLADPQRQSLKGTSATILLVDDDDQVRAITAAMLEDLGYKVRDVDGGEAALRILAQDAEIDILLTDLVMPGMNGFQLATAVKARHVDLSIVFISGYADQIGDMPALGARLIRKPFSAEDLYQAIEAVLTERHAVLSGA
jgi:signal transduction histidine kinase/ActR/RegA family two-component response regulator